MNILKFSRVSSRFCSDGSTIKDPKCCYGQLDFCLEPAKVADTETEFCKITAYWSNWGPWKGDCKTSDRQIRGRRCVAGTAGKTPGMLTKSGVKIKIHFHH